MSMPPPTFVKCTRCRNVHKMLHRNLSADRYKVCPCCAGRRYTYVVNQEA